MAVVSPGLCLPDALEMAARQVVIQHADTVNVHTTGANGGLSGGVA